MTVGRPEKPIDWDLLDQLLISDCKASEIAPHFDMHPNTLYLRVNEKYGMNYTNYSASMKEKGDSLIKNIQFSKALGLTKDGDNTLLIWLGKVRLQQVEASNLPTAPPNDNIINDKIENTILKGKIQELEKELNELKPKTNNELLRSDEAP